MTYRGGQYVERYLTGVGWVVDRVKRVADGWVLLEDGSRFSMHSPELRKHRFGGADEDRVSRRTRENRRAADLAFLERLRSADAELLMLMLDVEVRYGPQWRIVAIKRAMRRLEVGR